jgi:polysaccharide biosynthesis transport protein
VTDLRVRLALLIFLGFLGIGIAGALLTARMDSRLRTPDEVSGAMGINLLGTVPRLRKTDGRKGLLSARQVREAFRELRTNLIYAYGSAGPLVVTVSSGGIGEGKTLVTANLGIAFSELGQRTLILDADTRRGDIEQLLVCERKPGLTDFLRSDVSEDDIRQATAHPDLDFIGSGTQVENSPELLSSPAMGRLLANLRADYDVILVDSPPFGAGADPLVLASITGHLLLVVRSGTTHREFTQSKLEPLSRLPVRLLGAVLNDFEPARLSAYHQRYYGSYLPGYESGSEESVAPGQAGDSRGSEDSGKSKKSGESNRSDGQKSLVGRATA